MAPKRKLSLNAAGSAPSKRAQADPQSVDSSDEFSDDISESEAENLESARNKFTLSRRKQPQKKADGVGLFFGNKDFRYLNLKPDHDNRPLWINPENGRIILESFSPLAAHAQDFLTTIAEPLSRPHFLHEYSLTPHSLYAAVSVGVDPKDVIAVLERLSKVPLTTDLKDFIQKCTQSYGKLKLVLKHNKYFVESSDPAMLQRLLEDPIIGPLRIRSDEAFVKEKAPKMGGLVIPGTKPIKDKETAVPVDEPSDVLAALQADDENDDIEQVHSFEVPASGVEAVQKQCLHLGLPVLEEYDFRNDEINPNLDIDLKPTAQVRSYQEKSLSKMFGNGRAKSGIIVLPCGAGKTLVGITAACTIRKGVVILCNSNMSVIQWRQQFLQWTNINPSDIAIFTAEHKQRFEGNTGIIISTYSMVSFKNQRAHDSQKMMDFLTSKDREWGLMILDEVHVVPAEMFRTVTSRIATHSKLGLTATLLREDDKIKDLNFLIGPKLYEANWMELAEQGHIAKVQCAEVWCPMTTEFYQEYLRVEHRKRPLLYILNPKKFQACQYLIHYHESRGDKTIVFSDNIYSLEMYALKLGKAFIHGATTQAERMKILENFQHNDQINTIFLSQVGDTSLDLPEATCLIQISSHYGSRRQEAQRLGRILRAKRRNDEGFNAFFYSLVSKDTQEMYYSSKRQAFLVDQGYAFKVITHLQGLDELQDLAFSTPEERRSLLQQVMLQNESAAAIDGGDSDLFAGTSMKNAANRRKAARRTAGTLSELSGGQDMAYVEYNRSKNKDLKKGEHSAFFKKLNRSQAKQRASRLQDI